jgi:hypothetical protein
MSIVRLLSAVLISSVICVAKPVAQQPPLPYHFLLVISSQWNDPASYLVEGGGEFQVTVALLKTWGLPFEIMRLDHEQFDEYHLLDREGRPRHGTIIWDANPGDLKGKNLKLIRTLVREQGLGLVVLGDAVAAPEIAEMAGVRYESECVTPSDVSVSREDFITRDLKGREHEFPPANRSAEGYKVVPEGALVLATRGQHPFITAHEIEGGGRVVWLGAHRPSAEIKQQILRDIFKRCLVWTQGYALYGEYPKSIILLMDDMGTSEKTFLSYWNYRTLTEEEIRVGLIEPLKRRKAVLVQNVNTGFVDRKTRRVLNPWKQDHVVDELDGKTIHDDASTKKGLDAGLREGVFEIQSHGWTHMLPDLDSPPGPWWTAPLDGLGSLNWYTEFGDPVRNREVPAAVQKFHMQRALEYIHKDFGVTPLYINRGGGGFSTSYPNHSARIAAQLGFGLSGITRRAYLGKDFVIDLVPVAGLDGWSYDRKLSAADIPWSIDAPYFLMLHDRDVAKDLHSVERLLDGLGEGIRYMTANQYCAYLHARVERDTEASSTLALALNYDNHYCRYFESNKSRWTLHLSDETRQTLDKVLPEKQDIEIPAGLGHQVVRVASFKASHSKATRPPAISN